MSSSSAECFFGSRRSFSSSRCTLQRVNTFVSASLRASFVFLYVLSCLAVCGSCVEVMTWWRWRAVLVAASHLRIVEGDAVREAHGVEFDDAVHRECDEHERRDAGEHGAIPAVAGGGR